MASSLSLSQSFSSLHHQTSSPLIPRNPRPLHLRTQSRKPISIKALSAPILTQDDLKKLAANKAVDYIKPGMVLGLGTRSTTTFVVAKLGHLLQTGQLSNIVEIPTSKRTEEQARQLGIPLSVLDGHLRLHRCERLFAVSVPTQTICKTPRTR
jgi:ribose 5-phosphate isomerase A